MTGGNTWQTFETPQYGVQTPLWGKQCKHTQCIQLFCPHVFIPGMCQVWQLWIQHDPTYIAQ